MDYKQALKKLESLRKKIENKQEGSFTQAEQAEIAILYGECENIITQIIGVETVIVPSSHGASETYANKIEAGYLSSRTMHKYAGYQQLLKVIGRVRQLMKNPVLPQPVLSITQLVQTVRRFRECCQYLQVPPANERTVQDILWIMLRCQFDRVDRENTLPKFGVKSYRPDFGVPSLSSLIEVKYIGEKTQVQDIQKEILADVPGYLNETSRYSSIIVFVYDGAHKLRDPRAFIEDLRSVEGIIDVIVVPGVGA